MLLKYFEVKKNLRYINSRLILLHFKQTDNFSFIH